MAARPAAAVAEESELEALRVRQLAADTHFHAEVGGAFAALLCASRGGPWAAVIPPVQRAACLCMLDRCRCLALVTLVMSLVTLPWRNLLLFDTSVLSYIYLDHFCFIGLAGAGAPRRRPDEREHRAPGAGHGAQAGGGAHGR